jgi:hypothetical protein
VAFFIHPYAVRIDAVRGALGSESAPLLRRVDRLGLDPAAHLRVTQLIQGDPPRGDADAVALEHVVRAVGGEFLDNSQWAPFRSAWLQDVDAALQAAGVEARVSTLVFGTPPSPLPGMADIIVSATEHDAVAGVLARFEGWERVSGAEHAAVAQVRGWLDHAQATGRGLITFHIW